MLLFHMDIRLWRMSAAGNRFYLGLDLGLGDAEAAQLAVKLRGDSDGLILGSRLSPTMTMFNPDGSEALCGNGLRCLARLLADQGALRSGEAIATRAGDRCVRFDGDFVEAEMGAARDLPGEPGSRREGMILDWEGERLRAYGVDVGNPHLVLFGDEALLDKAPLWGPGLERHRRFPERINVELATGAPGGWRVRVWERGAGETLSCGTGALAVASAGPEAIAPGQRRSLRYPGGVLEVRSDAEGRLHLGGEVEREGSYLMNARGELIPLREEDQ